MNKKYPIISSIWSHLVFAATKIVPSTKCLQPFSGVPVVVGVTIFILSFSSVSESAMVFKHSFKFARNLNEHILNCSVFKDTIMRQKYVHILN